MAVTDSSTAPDRSLEKLTIPRVVRRNTLLLAISQALAGAGGQLIPALGPIMVIELIGSVALSGITTTIAGVTRFLIAYPIGRVMDIYGRRAGIMIGLAMGAIGALLTGLSALWVSFPLFIVGLLIFGLGIGAVGQLRLAAADMYPQSRRAEGIGYVLTGTVVGAVIAPVLVTSAQAVSSANVPTTALAWLFVPVLALVSIGLVARIHPDPRDIAANLNEYYPGQVLPKEGAVVAPSGNIREFLRHYPKLVAFVSASAAFGNMTMLMVVTTVALAHHGHGLPAISLSVAIHVVGMFGLSIPLGALSDRVGRRKVLFGGTVIAAAGALLVPQTPLYLVITTGTFLVGVGWSCVNVAATAVIADCTQPSERGRAIGVNDTLSSAIGAITPIVGSVLVEAIDLQAAGVLGVLLMVPPFLMLLRLREPRPGQYQREGYPKSQESAESASIAS